MKKLALVALLAVAATGAFAQTVAVTGNLDETYYNQGSSQAWLHNGNSTSVWAITGSEDLGNGLRAKFNLVSELNLMKGQVGSTSTGPASSATTTATAGQTTDVFNRGANLALESPVGTVTVGRQADLWYSTMGTLNTSGSNSFGFGNLTSVVSNTNALKFITATPVGLTGYSTSTLSNNGNTGPAIAFVGGVAYATPTVYGFRAQIQSGTNSYNEGGSNEGIAYALSYTQGPLNLAYATTIKNDAAGSQAWTNSVYGGTYNAGAFTYIVAVNKTTFGGLAAANDNLSIYSTGVNYVVNSKVDMNVSYGVLMDDTVTANKATSVGLTARYKLSARTQLYSGLGRMTNAGAANVSSIYTGSGTAMNTSTDAFMLGIKHTF
jgi:hypothetical protein